VLLTISNVDLSPSSSGEESHGTRPKERLAGDGAVLLEDLVSRVSIGVEISVTMGAHNPGGHSSNNTLIQFDRFQTAFIRISSFLLFLKFLWVFFFDRLDLLVGDAATL
jgi:hypothetical protein